MIVLEIISPVRPALTSEHRKSGYSLGTTAPLDLLPDRRGGCSCQSGGTHELKLELGARVDLGYEICISVLMVMSRVCILLLDIASIAPVTSLTTTYTV